MVITGLYAGLLGLFYVVLSARVIRGRFQNRVSLGDGGVDALALRIRAHGNFIEYVPLALILMAVLDAQAASPILLHGLGIALVAGRAAHAVGLIKSIFALRVGGTVLTLAVLVASSVAAIATFAL